MMAIGSFLTAKLAKKRKMGKSATIGFIGSIGFAPI
jgi:hypothetical protein